MCSMSFTMDHGSDGYTAAEQKAMCQKKASDQHKSYVSKKTLINTSTSNYIPIINMLASLYVFYVC